MKFGMKKSSEPKGNQSGSTKSNEYVLDIEQDMCCQSNSSTIPSNSLSLQEFASSGQLSESNAAYFSWPMSTRLNDAAKGRANFFGNLQKGVLPRNLDRPPRGQQASTLLDVMTIRAFHSKILRRFSLGTAIGFRIRKGVLTDIPAILVFVARKVHKKWLNHLQCLPHALEGPGGVWCDVDVIEFLYYGAPASTSKDQPYNELVDDLRGGDPCIGPGSQVASLESFGTLSAIVKSRTGMRQVGFLTNRHVAVDLDYPKQKMFHPLPPNLGHGVYLGAVERATSFITDDLWYGIFAGANPETFVRADGAFIPFSDDFEISSLTTSVKGVGNIGEVRRIDLQSPLNMLIGKQVVKVGRSSGLTTGTVMAYALEYNDDKGICFFTDFLVVGDNQQTFDLEGDSGSLIILTEQGKNQPRPIGIIWGGTANRGRLKLTNGLEPENWTSGVDLGRLLDLLELDLITTKVSLQEAVQEQRNAMAAAFDSTASQAEETPIKGTTDDIFEPLGINIQQISIDASGMEINACFGHGEFHVDGIEIGPKFEEHQFIPNSPVHRKQGGNPELSLSALRNASDEDGSISLHLGDDRESKRQRTESTLANE